MVSLVRLAVALVLCAVLLAAHVATARLVPPHGVRPYQTKFHSLSQACHGVLEDRCPPGQANRADCLQDNFEDNSNHECRLWVGWRTLCLVYVDKKVVPQGLCGFTEEEATSQKLRECLQTLDRTVLPAACYDTPYFKSLTLHAARRMDDDSDL